MSTGFCCRCSNVLNPQKKQDKKPEDQMKKDISKLGGFSTEKTVAGPVDFFAKPVIYRQFRNWMSIWRIRWRI